MVRAAVETVAENAVDGVLSVLFFAVLGYAVGGCAGAVLCVWIEFDSTSGERNSSWITESSRIALQGRMEPMSDGIPQYNNLLDYIQKYSY